MMELTLRCFGVLVFFSNLLSLPAMADGHFKTVGKLDSFSWAPPTYTTGFEYDIFYYIPQSIVFQPKSITKSILFMHGGGQSTMTREGAAWAVGLYTKDFIKIAEEQNLIVVFPSSSGLNWGGHTRVFLRELAKLMREELSIDPDGIGLIGHSMGGMGITRNAFFLGDQFAFAMPIAAGMDPVVMSDENLLPLFNFSYHHVQGLHDHFEVFVERAKLHAEKMKALETKLGKPSLFKLSLMDWTHNYDTDELSSIIAEQFQKSRRNLFQRDLYGSFIYANQIITDNNIQFNYTSNPDYFWLQAKEFTPTEKTSRSNFEAHITGNQVWVDFNGKHNVKILRVSLSKSMVTFLKPISIMVNGIRKFHGMVRTRVWKQYEMFTERSDSGFSFDTYVDIDVSDSQNTDAPMN